MSHWFTYSLVSFGSLFSIVDPFAAVPLFLALVGAHSPAEQRRTALAATLTTGVVLTVFGLAGTLIFSFFGITIPAFKIAGGVVLFMSGLEMIRAKHSETRATDEERREAVGKQDVGLVPLGIPLLSGPGAIATVMVLVGKARTLEHKAGVFVAILLVALGTYVTLRSAVWVSRALGRTGMNAIGRVMGLILAAIAMQFVIDGVHEAWPRG